MYTIGRILILFELLDEWVQVNAHGYSKGMIKKYKDTRANIGK